MGTICATHPTTCFSACLALHCRIMKRLIIQFLKFSAVGLSAFAIDYALFVVLHLLGTSYLIANIVSYTLANIYNFLLSMKYVFAGRTGQSRTEQGVIFTILSIVGLGLNELFLWLLVQFIIPLPVVSKVIATFLVMIFNYITRKWFFEDHGKGIEEEGAFDLTPEEMGCALWEGAGEMEKIFREEIDIITGKEKL